jgi:hypothetical protein
MPRHTSSSCGPPESELPVKGKCWDVETQPSALWQSEREKSTPLWYCHTPTRLECPRSSGAKTWVPPGPANKNNHSERRSGADKKDLGQLVVLLPCSGQVPAASHVAACSAEIPSGPGIQRDRAPWSDPEAATGLKSGKGVMVGRVRGGGVTLCIAQMVSPRKAIECYFIDTGVLEHPLLQPRVEWLLLCSANLVNRRSLAELLIHFNTEHSSHHNARKICIVASLMMERGVISGI